MKREEQAHKAANTHGTRSSLLSPLLLLRGLVLTLAASCPFVACCLSPDLSAHIVGEVKRDWFDPCLGSHWELVTNPAHPEWPGRLILVDSAGRRLNSQIGNATSPPSEAAGRSESQPNASDAANLSASYRFASQSSPVAPFAIRAGDRITVAQQTQILNAQFQGVALEAASIGQHLRVRLGAGTHSGRGLDGGVVIVLLTAAGQATWVGPEAARFLRVEP